MSGYQHASGRATHVELGFPPVLLFPLDFSPMSRRLRRLLRLIDGLAR